MGAVIDISSISLYSIGALPSLIENSDKKETSILDTPILERNIITDKDQSTFISYKYDNKPIPECMRRIKGHRYYIVGRKIFKENQSVYSDEKEMTWQKDEVKYCALGNDVYRFKTLFAFDDNKNNAAEGITKEKIYENKVATMRGSSAVRDQNIKDGKIILSSKICKKESKSDCLGRLPITDKFYGQMNDKEKKIQYS